MSEETAARLEAWAEQRGSKAISGEDGHKEAVDLVNQLRDDAVKLHPEVDG